MRKLLTIACLKFLSQSVDVEQENLNHEQSKDENREAWDCPTDCQTISTFKCPGCQKSDIKKLDGQRAICRSCSKAKRTVFQFCWACQREWPRSDLTTNSCTLPKCAFRAALLSVIQISDPQSSVDGCPYFRACPECQALLTHSGEGCPNIICPHCNEEFCFRCLRTGCYGNVYYNNDDDDADEYYDSDDDDPEPCVIADNAEILKSLGL